MFCRGLKRHRLRAPDHFAGAVPVQGVDRAARQAVVLSEQVGQDLVLVEASVEQDCDGAGDELGQLVAILEHDLGDDLCSVFLVRHELAGVDVIVDLGHGDAETLRHLGERQQRFTAQQGVEVVCVGVMLCRTHAHHLTHRMPSTG